MQLIHPSLCRFSHLYNYRSASTEVIILKHLNYLKHFFLKKNIFRLHSTNKDLWGWNSTLWFKWDSTTWLECTFEVVKHFSGGNKCFFSSTNWLPFVNGYTHLVGNVGSLFHQCSSQEPKINFFQLSVNPSSFSLWLLEESIILSVFHRRLRNMLPRQLF